MGGVSAHDRGLKTDNLEGPFQPEPFYDSVLFLLKAMISLFSPDVEIC